MSGSRISLRIAFPGVQQDVIPAASARALPPLVETMLAEQGDAPGFLEVRKVNAGPHFSKLPPPVAAGMLEAIHWVMGRSLLFTPPSAPPARLYTFAPRVTYRKPRLEYYAVSCMAEGRPPQRCAYAILFNSRAERLGVKVQLPPGVVGFP